MAYSPRSDLLTPTVAPDTQGLGPGITAGMNNFSSLVSQGLANKRQDQRDTKIWEQTLQRDQANYTHDYSMLDKRQTMSNNKEIASKAEEADFASAAWADIKARMPEVITPELDEKFVSGSLGTKRGLLVQSQAAYTNAMKSQMEAEERAAKAKAANTWTPAPSSDTYQINGQGSMVPPARSKPQPGFQDMGNGITAAFGPNGQPINPAYLMQGPAGDLQPVIPPKSAAPPKPARLVPRETAKGITWYDPYTGQPVAGADVPPAPRSKEDYYRKQDTSP